MTSLLVTSKAFQSAAGHSLHTLDHANFTHSPTCPHATGEVARKWHAVSLRATGNDPIPWGHGEDPGDQSTIFFNRQDSAAHGKGHVTTDS